jgi:predicted Zn-dependent protease
VFSADNEAARMPDLAKLQALLEQEPDNCFLNFGVAMELARLERHEEALVAFERVIELDPDYTVAYLQQGRLLLRLGRREDARQALSAGLAAARRGGDAHAETEMSKLLTAMS